MFANDDAKLIAHKDKNCDYSSCDQLHKPDKILKLEIQKMNKKENLNTDLVQVDSNLIDADIPTSNVVLIAEIIKLADQRRVAKLRQANFNYPMLECS